MAGKKWDAFISHASEDKDFAKPLAKILARLGINIWYDEFELKAGDSLVASIDNGLANSSFGILILSKAFFSKNWTEREYRGLTTLELNGDGVILPIWRDVDRSTVANFSPHLSDKFALQADTADLQSIALSIVEIIDPDAHSGIIRRKFYRDPANFVQKNVPLSSLKSIIDAPIRHAKFPSHFESRVFLTWSILNDYTGWSLEYFMEGFQKDSHPTQEIAIWERVAFCLSIFEKNNRAPSKSVRKSVFGFLMRFWCAGEKLDLILKQSDLNEKNRSIVLHAIGLLAAEVPYAAGELEGTDFNKRFDKENFPDESVNNVVDEMIKR
ncbi:MAG: toll/interleukin-1 receptor domain-containing protein [Pseudomonadota bacterium]